MSQKKIGVVGWNTGENTFGVGKNYLTWISKFGAPIILTPHNREIENLDLLILPGGADINPWTYGEIPHFNTGTPNVMLEYFDAVMLPQYIESGIPIFAICRGAQKLWTLAGGSLDQHNNWHAQSESGTNDVAHGLCYTQDYKNWKGLLNKVNSRHHQTMDASGISKGIPDILDVIAYSEANKSNSYFPQIVEMFKFKTKEIYGVQFHPEDLPENELIPQIINSLLKN